MQIQRVGVAHAMLGHPGHYVAEQQETQRPSSSGSDEHDDDDDVPRKFRCSPAAESLLSSSETEAINFAVRRGGSVAYLRSFVRDSRRGAAPTLGDDGSGRGQKGRRRQRAAASLYLSSIAGAVEELLRGYHAAVADAEAQIAVNPELGLEYLHAETAPSSSWIPAVTSVVSSLLRPGEDAWGCKSLDVVNAKLARCGDDASREAVEKLRDAAASVLWNQVWHWIDRGVLVDPHGEFFVSREGHDSGDHEATTKDGSAVGGNDTDDEKFALVLKRLPSSSVSISTAQRILFSGSSVRILRRHERYQNYHEMEHECNNRYNRFSLSTTERALELLVDDVYTNISRKLCLLLKETCCLLSHVENMHKSFLLGDGVFYMQLQEECDRMRKSGDWSSVVEHVFGEGLEEFPGRKWWFHNRVIIPIWNLLYKLEVPEVYHDDHSSTECLFDSSRSRAGDKDGSQLSDLVRFSLTSRTGPDPHAAGKLLEISLFQLSQSDAADRPHAHRTRLALCDIHSTVMEALSSEVGAAGHGNSESRGSGNNGAILKIDYRVPSSLALLLISPDTTTHLYLACFRRLFALHRAQFGLRQCWRIMMSPQSRRSSDAHLFSPQLWALRSHMEFVVNTLFSYLQCDVTECAMHEFRTRVLTSDRYEDLREAHGLYAGKIRRGLFLDDAAVGEALSKVLALIHRLVALVERIHDLSSDTVASEVTRLRLRFNDEVVALFGFLQKMDASSRLCVRLDFNGWLSRQ